MSLGLVLGEADTIRLDARFAGRMACQILQDVVWGELDFLLLDLPPGTGEPQQTLLHTIHIHGVLLVTTSQDLSLMDTSRSLGLFRQAHVPILGIIENMSYLYCPHCHEPIDVFSRSEHTWGVYQWNWPSVAVLTLDIPSCRLPTPLGRWRFESSQPR